MWASFKDGAVGLLARSAWGPGLTVVYTLILAFSGEILAKFLLDGQDPWSASGGHVALIVVSLIVSGYLLARMQHELAHLVGSGVAGDSWGYALSRVKNGAARYAGYLLLSPAYALVAMWILIWYGPFSKNG